MANHIFIILVNFNGHNHTIECLESLSKLKFEGYNVIIVDNSYTDDSLNFLLKWITSKQRVHQLILEDKLVNRKGLQRQEILLIRQNQNRGFAAANNAAIRFLTVNRINYSYLWLLNNDTVVDTDSLSELVSFTDISDKSVGIVGSKLLFYKAPSMIQAVGGSYNPWLGRVNEIGLRERDLGQYDNCEIRFEYVIGASMFIRKDFIDKVGLMSEDFFIYFEELDWALRGKKLGFKSAFCAKSKILHKGGASINSESKRSLLSDFYYLRNRILISKKYFPQTLLTLYPILVLSILYRLLKGERSKIKFLLGAISNSDKKLNAF